MKLSDEGLKNLWQQSAQPSERIDCLSSELLVRAGADNLTTQERSQIATHIGHCQSCAKEFRIVSAVNDWALQITPQYATALAPNKKSENVAENWWRKLFGFGFSPLTAALTASLLIFCLGLVWWLSNERRQNEKLVAQLLQQNNETAEIVALKKQLEALQNPPTTPSPQTSALPQMQNQANLRAEITKLKNEIAALTRPQLDVPQIDVDPNNETRGANEAGKNIAPMIRVPASASTFTINLPGAGSKAFASYLLELYDVKNGKLVWSGKRAQDKETTFTLTLAKQNLPAGKYRIKVSGLDGTKRKLIYNYDLQIAY